MNSIQLEARTLKDKNGFTLGNLCVGEVCLNQLQRTAVSPGISYISYVDLRKTRVFPSQAHTNT